MRKLMLTSEGTYSDPGNKYCWKYCTSCGRCANKGSRPECGGCSGRLDPKGQRHPDRDDYCRCTQGVMQWVSDKGQFLQFKLLSDPFKGTVKYEGNTQDEADWESYLKDAREILDDEFYDPIQIGGVGGASEWYNQQKRGR